MINTVIIIFIVTITSCKKSNEEPVASIVVKSNVTLTKPEFNSISEYMHFNAVTEFLRRDNIRATSTGYMSSVFFNPGNSIQRGTVFCEIATKEQKALKTLSETDSTLQKFQKPLPVESNALGIISTINVLTGDYVNEGDVLATVIEPGSLVLNLNVPYEFNKYIKSGTSCEIILPDERVINANISNSLLTVDPKTMSQVFLIKMGGYSLPENLNVTVRISVNKKTNVLSLPLEAVQTDEEQKEFWVMKLVDDSLAVKFPVITGTQNDSLIEIISDDISSDDRIILQGAYELPD
ncbi:MAG: HlyD family efflux transporter periplasmic adaptor subunit, partial [Ignavibacteria bacterium]|nr:HlyD family efflux transporter periplasmic adaptor subunit [Ignavibacteria bacterium]